MLDLLKAATLLVSFSTQATQPAPDAAQMQQMMHDFRQSQIQGNVPEGAKFDSFLKRDLSAYFEMTGLKSPAVHWELLRKEPTQVGVSFPKYYAWVSAVSPDGRSVVGAVRLAAIGKQRFIINVFVPVESIKAEPDRLRSIFPEVLVPEIRRRAAG